MTVIESENLGPTERFSFPLPDEGGFTVLCGAAGTGKSEHLKAIQNALSGSGQIPKRDGAACAKISVGRASAVARKTTRHLGVAEVTHLGGRLCLGDLIDPGLVDPKKADAARVRALIRIADCRIGADAIREVIGVAADSIEGRVFSEEDPVELVRKCKADLQKQALEMEREAVAEAAKASVCIPADLDLDAESDQKVLSGRLADAIRIDADISGRVSQGAQVKAAAEKARARLAEVEAGYKGPTVGESAMAVLAAEKAEAKAASEWRSARDALDAAIAGSNASADHAVVVASIRKTIEESECVDVPADDAAKAAKDALAEASRAQELGVRIRAVKAQMDEGQRHREKAAVADAEAKELRAAAAKMDEVLTKAIPDCGLRLVDGRLVTKTDRPGDTFFSDLSSGERGAMAVRIAAPYVGEEGILVVPQEVWEGIDVTNQMLIHEQAKALRINGIAAEAQREGQPAWLHAHVCGDSAIVSEPAVPGGVEDRVCAAASEGRLAECEAEMDDEENAPEPYDISAAQWEDLKTRL